MSCCKPNDAPPAGGMGMPSMMAEMMQKMMGGMKDFNPMVMCQTMCTSVAKSAEMAAYATPEVRGLFEEWAGSVEAEVLRVLRSRGPLDLATLARELRIGPESALSFLVKLVRDGQVTIGEIQVTPAQP